MVGDHEAAGAIPVTQTSNCFTPPFRGTGHDFAKIVGRGSTPLGGTNAWHSSRRADPTRTSLIERNSWSMHSDVMSRGYASPSGTVLVSKAGCAAFDSLAAC